MSARMQYTALQLLNIDLPNASPHSSSLWKSLEKKQVEVILEKIMYLKRFAWFAKHSNIYADQKLKVETCSPVPTSFPAQVTVRGETK